MLLVVMAAGLFAYSLWRLADAAFFGALWAGSWWWVGGKAREQARTEK